MESMILSLLVVAVVSLVTGYALYTFPPPKKGERTALPPGEPDRPFPVGFLV